MNKTNAVLLVGSIAVGLVIFILHVFFHTEVGLAIRSTDDNTEMSEANGIRTNVMKVIGYMLSNGLITTSGALLAQNNGYADISMGIGTIVIGLASIIISEVFFRNLSIAKRLMTVVLGSVIYRLLILIILEMNVNPQDLVFLFIMTFCALQYFYNPRRTYISPFCALRTSSNLAKGTQSDFQSLYRSIQLEKDSRIIQILLSPYYAL